jgi:hypothetical protein
MKTGFTFCFVASGGLLFKQQKIRQKVAPQVPGGCTAQISFVGSMGSATYDMGWFCDNYASGIMRCAWVALGEEDCNRIRVGIG